MDCGHQVRTDENWKDLEKDEEKEEEEEEKDEDDCKGRNENEGRSAIRQG